MHTAIIQKDVRVDRCVEANHNGGNEYTYALVRRQSIIGCGVAPDATMAFFQAEDTVHVHAANLTMAMPI